MFSEESKVSQLANKNVVAMHAYTPGEQPQGTGWVKLNTNENPYPPSTKVAEALQKEIGADGSKLRLYPNPTSKPLRETLGKFHDVPADWILVGNVWLGPAVKSPNTVGVCPPSKIAPAVVISLVNLISADFFTCNSKCSGAT